MNARILRGREMAGLTMGQAARLLGLAVTQISDLELGKVDPTPAQLAALADCYGLSAAWLGGAEPVVPAATGEMLRAADISSDERDQLLELFGSMGKRGES